MVTSTECGTEFFGCPEQCKTMIDGRQYRIASYALLVAFPLLFNDSIPACGQEQATVSGIVQDVDGKPIADADIGTQWDFLGHRLVPWNRALSDASGRFKTKTQVSTTPTVVLAFDDQRRIGSSIWLPPDVPMQGLELTLRPLSHVTFRMVCSELNTVISSGLVEIEAVHPDAPPFPKSTEIDALRKWFEELPPAITPTVSIATPSFRGPEIHLSLPAGQYLIRFDTADMQDVYYPLVVKQGVEAPLPIEIDVSPLPMARLVAKQAPDWHITDCKGLAPDAQPSDFRDKWLLVQFWSYWNGRSVERTIPGLMSFLEKNPQLSDRLQIVAIHHKGADSIADLEKELVSIKKSVWNNRDLPFPVIVDDTDASAKAYGIKELPAAVLVSPDGRVNPYHGIGELKEIVTGRIRHHFKTIEERHPPGGLPTIADSPRAANHLKIKPIHRLTDHKSNVDRLILHPTNGSFYSCGMDMVVSQYELSTGKRLHELRLHDKIQFSSDSPRILLNERRNHLWTTVHGSLTEQTVNDFALRSFDAERLEPVASTERVFSGYRQFAIHNDRLLDIRWDNKRSFTTFTVQDLNTRRIEVEWKSPLRVFVARFSPDGSMVVCGGTADGLPKSTFAHKVDSGERVWLKSLEEFSAGAVDVAFSPDGTHCVVSDWEDQVHIRNVSDGEIVQTFSLAGHDAMAAGFSPDGKFLASAGANISPIVIWDLQTGQRVAALIGHRRGRIYRVEFASKRKLVSVGGGMGEGEVCIWELPDVLTR